MAGELSPPSGSGEPSPTQGITGPGDPSFAATVAALAVGQLLCWAALYYSFASFVLPMMRELAWSKSLLMGAFTAGLAASGLATFAAGMGIDRGHGRALMTLGALLGAATCAAWSQVHAPWALYACCVALGTAMAMTRYEPRRSTSSPTATRRATARRS